MPNACSDAARALGRCTPLRMNLYECQLDIDDGRRIAARDKTLADIKALREALDAAERELAG